MALRTTSGAGQELRIPVSTLLGLEKRGVVGPFQRDTAGRRLLTDGDIEAIRQYLQARSRTISEAA